VDPEILAGLTQVEAVDEKAADALGRAIGSEFADQLTHSE
jgi:hypothetical protein